MAHHCSDTFPSTIGEVAQVAEALPQWMPVTKAKVTRPDENASALFCTALQKREKSSFTSGGSRAVGTIGQPSDTRSESSRRESDSRKGLPACLSPAYLEPDSNGRVTCELQGRLSETSSHRPARFENLLDARLKC